MTVSLNGFGTTYYGACDFQPDGSYVTTECVILAGFPILPFRSWRLVPIRNENWVVFSQTNYKVNERVPLHWGQVIRVYLFAASFILLPYSVVLIHEAIVRNRPDKPDPLWEFFGVGGGFIIAIAIPFIVRSILYKLALYRVGLVKARKK